MNKELDSGDQKDDPVQGSDEPTRERNLEKGRGRQAATPTRIPLPGWRDIALRIKAAIRTDHIPIVSAGVAFFLLLGIIPGLGALLMMYGFISDPEDVSKHFAGAAHFIPSSAYEVLVEQMEEVAQHDTGVGFGAILSILFAVWAGSRGTKGLIQALNIAYKEEESRKMIPKQLTAFALTIALIVTGLIALLLVAGLPVILGIFSLGPIEEALVSWLRWPILLIMFVFGLSVLYRFAPSRRQAKWKWVSVGSAFATLSWLLASAAFSLYVTHFGNFNETFGSLGAIVVLMLWLYLTSFLILIGAEINGAMEHQTAKDTTRGKWRPMGKRGAYVADNLGESP